jgi:hypothetical protein
MPRRVMREQSRERADGRYPSVSAAAQLAVMALLPRPSRQAGSPFSAMLASPNRIDERTCKKCRSTA